MTGRALDDPVQLARAARIVRAALARKERGEYVKRLVDAAPPLTAEQRDRLAVVLRSSKPPKPINDQPTKPPVPTRPLPKPKPPKGK